MQSPTYRSETSSFMDHLSLLLCWDLYIFAWSINHGDGLMGLWASIPTWRMPGRMSWMPQSCNHFRIRSNRATHACARTHFNHTWPNCLKRHGYPNSPSRYLCWTVFPSSLLEHGRVSLKFFMTLDIALANLFSLSSRRKWYCVSKSLVLRAQR